MRQRLVGAGEEEAGDVEGVDRLDQQPDAGLLQRGCREAQVGDQRRVRMLMRDARRQLAGQAVDLRAAQRLGVVDGPRHAVAELGHAVRVAGDAALARLPVAGRQVVQHLLQAVGAQGGGQFLLGIGIGEQVLDGVEARARAAAKRSMNGSSVKSMVRLAANWGMVSLFSRASSVAA